LEIDRDHKEGTNCSGKDGDQYSYRTQTWLLKSWSLGSKHIREQVRPLVQVGMAVPLFGLTKWGKELLIERAKEVEQPLLINTMPLPVLPSTNSPGSWFRT
jgi:hypothetical protein